MHIWTVCWVQMSPEQGRKRGERRVNEPQMKQPRTGSLMLLWLCVIYATTNHTESTTFLQTFEVMGKREHITGAMGVPI